jgi:site-specific DNA-methyltransferase (adenine-specific)
MKITDKIEITNEDNMELMKRYPDNYFDLAIVDPPYGIGWDKEFSIMSAGIRKDGSIRKDPTWNGRHKKKIYKSKEWDNKRPNNEYFEELKRISKNQIIWGGNYFTDYLKPHGGWIVWEKGVPEGMSLSQAELAYNTCLNSVNIFKVLWAGYKKADNEQRFHPTQKPVALYKWLLDKYAKQGDKILDTHLGSGSIAIAAHDYGFELTCCELDVDYYNKAVERIKNHVSQIKLEF